MQHNTAWTPSQLMRASPPRGSELSCGPSGFETFGVLSHFELFAESWPEHIPSIIVSATLDEDGLGTLISPTYTRTLHSLYDKTYSFRFRLFESISAVYREYATIVPLPNHCCDEPEQKASSVLNIWYY